MPTKVRMMLLHKLGPERRHVDSLHTHKVSRWVSMGRSKTAKAPQRGVHPRLLRRRPRALHQSDAKPRRPKAIESLRKPSKALESLR